MIVDIPDVVQHQQLDLLLRALDRRPSVAARLLHVDSYCPQLANRLEWSETAAAVAALVAPSADVLVFDGRGEELADTTGCIHVHIHERVRHRWGTRVFAVATWVARATPPLCMIMRPDALGPDTEREHAEFLGTHTVRVTAGVTRDVVFRRPTRADIAVYRLGGLLG